MKTFVDDQVVVIRCSKDGITKAIMHTISEKIKWFADANLVFEQSKTEIVTMGCRIESVWLI